MLAWAHEYGANADALRLKAQLTPGLYVEGWTDRPLVATEFERYWDSWTIFASFEEWTPQAVTAWVEQQFGHEPARVRRTLVQVWAKLIRVHLSFQKPAEPRPPMID